MLINDASITGSLIVNASASLQNISLGGNIIPDETNLRNLGSTEKFFKEIYVSTGSINFVDGGNIVAVLSAGTITAIQSNTSSANSRLNAIEIITSSTTARLSALETSSASVDTLNTNQNSRLGSLEMVSASNISRITALETTSASVDTLNTTQNSRLSALETTSASVDTLNTTQNSRLDSLEIKTGSLATTGSNTFIGTQTITGSLFISANLVVQGTSSLQNITASAVNIGTNIVNLNTANPAIRFAGLVIGDSGSVGGSGSFLYDSVQDEMIFVHRGASTVVTSSVTLMGPETYDSVGSETYLTSNRITKGTGNEHLSDSCIFDNGTTVCINANLVGSGTGTFSSNVIATRILINSNDTAKTPLLLNAEGNFASSGNMTSGFAITNTSFGRALNMGVFESGAYGWIQSAYINNADTTFALALQPRGGNVGIGTNVLSGSYEKLAVAGGISIKDNTNAKLEIGRYNTTGAQNSYIKLGASSNSLRFTNNTDIADIMELTNSGNLSVIGTMTMSSPFTFRNKIHNGNMGIDQRYNGGTISNSEGTRPVDRFIIYNQIASSWSTQRSTVAPPGFSNSLLATSTTGGSIGIGSYGGIRHLIEGLNTIDLAWGTASAKNVTVSFWVRSSVIGTYGFVIRNGANNYGYVSTYTISSANTWTYITLNIPGPTSGTWATDNSTSLNCIWDLGAGTLYSATAGSWVSASEILGVTGGIKFFTNSNATYYLTGVQLEIGNVATPFEFLPYDVQLRQVQRYFQKWGNGVMFQAGQLGQVGGAYDFFKMIGGGVFGGGEMRDTPTISYDPAGTYWVGVGTAGTGTIGDAGTIPSSQYASPQSLHILKTGIGRLGIGFFDTFSPTPIRGRWYVPNSDFVWVSAEI